MRRVLLGQVAEREPHHSRCAVMLCLLGNADAVAYRQGRTVVEQQASQEPPPDRRIDLTRHPESPLTAREQLALALDGRLPTGDVDARNGYRVAGRLLIPHLRRMAADLRLMPGALFSVIPSRYDHMNRVVVAAGFVDRVQPLTSGARAGGAPAPVLLVGSDMQPLTDALIRAHLQQGGLVVTSDRAADLPVFTTLGVHVRHGRSQHVRVARDASAQRDYALQSAAGRLQPAVRLSAGHRSVVGLTEPEHDVHVLARDASTRLPLVMLLRVDNGFLLHSVAHWWQNETPDHTDLGRRELRRTPGFGGITNGTARWGEFHAGYCLLSCLIRSMQIMVQAGGFSGGTHTQVAA